MDTYWLCKHWGNPVWETKRRSFTMVLPLPWYCPFCILKLFFSSVKNKYFLIIFLIVIMSQFHKKWTRRLKNYWKKFCEMSQIVEQSENPHSCDYYDISDFKKEQVYSSYEHFFHFSTDWWFLNFPQSCSVASRCFSGIPFSVIYIVLT